ncbi:MAG: P1 family peptidase [Ilumatobacteraceae bacterium]
MTRTALPGGCLTDIPGIAVGHHQRSGRGWLTGTTVAVLPPGSVAGVDVRGGGPGTRETDLLHPLSTIATAHAICLTGGSAYGLSAADGVMGVLEERAIGFEVGVAGTASSGCVPLVPAAVIFDLGRGGNFRSRPDADFGRRAALAARPTPSPNGSVGAGTGARAGGIRGGVGTASAVVELPGMAQHVGVAALVVVNAAGAVIDPSTGLPWAAGDDRLRAPSSTDRRALAAHVAGAVPPLNTTIGIVATSAVLTKPEAGRLALVGHDGLARSIRPVHSLFDGDTLFGVATCATSLDGDTPRARTVRLNAVLDAAAQCVARACTNAVVRAEGAGSYRSLCPSAFAGSRPA